MGFYYFSILSVIPLALAYGPLALAFALIEKKTRGRPRRKPWLIALAVVFLLLPISEELWIAWNFGQACKEAGTFIHKKVQVEGFYDDTRTTHSGPPTPQAIASFDKSGYRFLEMRGKEKYVRLERINGQWKPTVIDRPTARYHFKATDSGTPVSRRIVKSQTVVLDTEKDELIARYTRFGRAPAWFFLGLDAPAFACDAPGRWPLTKDSLLVYREVLIPEMQ